MQGLSHDVVKNSRCACRRSKVVTRLGRQGRTTVVRLIWIGPYKEVRCGRGSGAVGGVTNLRAGGSGGDRH